jgi:prolyl-tRNA synthetase
MSNFVGRRTKETPREATAPSHIFLLRGAYARPLSTGIYSILPLGLRIIRKIENIIRQEMDGIGGQEVLMPVVQPRELWEESRRYDAIGSELLRFKDRNAKDMVLAMTHEEAVCHLFRSEVDSYKQLPVMLYQIQTKYRDEARPRAGLIRVREFTMKDAYSFHDNMADLESYYEVVLRAYSRIFERIGLNDVAVIQSDSGMMGGKVAHEFMAVSEVGEDRLMVTADGSYMANREVAKTGIVWRKEESKPLEKVHTPERRTIEEVSEFVGVDREHTCKAVMYADQEGKLIMVCLRGDLEVNPIKLCNYLGTADITEATDQQILDGGAVPGYAAARGLDPRRVRILFDPSAKESSNLVIGANEIDYHYINFNFERDLADIAQQIEIVDIATARAGDPSPTGQPLIEKRGIEVGNIFQLGTRYSQAMSCAVLDRHGKEIFPIMGCYGIGVGRCMASVIEQNHDQWGPIWPKEIAPYQVQICTLKHNQTEVREAADAIYVSLQELGIEVIYDDRNESPGVQFADADLLGVPLRLIISPKTLAKNQVEFKSRDGKHKDMLPLDQVIDFIKKYL